MITSEAKGVYGKAMRETNVTDDFKETLASNSSVGKAVAKEHNAREACLVLVLPALKDAKGGEHSITQVCRSRCLDAMQLGENYLFVLWSHREKAAGNNGSFLVEFDQ